MTDLPIEPEIDDDEGDGDPLASIGQRVGARVIDWFLILAITASIGLIAVSGDPQQEIPVWATLSSLLFVFFYETVGVALRGQTLGKAVLGIELVSLATGERPSLLASGARALPIVVLMALLQQFAYPALVFLYFTAGFMTHNRGVLDRIAGTVVIQGRRPGFFG